MLSENAKKRLDEYLEIFEQGFVDQFKKDMKERTDRRENFFRCFHSFEAIKSLSLDDFKEKFSKLWAFQFWSNKDWYFENIMKLNAKTFPDLKENIAKLCFSNESIETRVNAFLEQTQGMQIAYISEVLYLSTNSKFPIYNQKAKEFLKQLGVNLRDRLPRGNKRNLGLIYKEFLSVYQEVLDYMTSKKQNDRHI